MTALDPCLWNQSFRIVLLNVYPRKGGKILEKKKMLETVHFPEMLHAACCMPATLRQINFMGIFKDFSKAISYLLNVRNSYFQGTYLRV